MPTPAQAHRKSERAAQHGFGRPAVATRPIRPAPVSRKPTKPHHSPTTAREQVGQQHRQDARVGEWLGELEPAEGGGPAQRAQVRVGVRDHPDEVPGPKDGGAQPDRPAAGSTSCEVTDPTPTMSAGARDQGEGKHPSPTRAEVAAGACHDPDSGDDEHDQQDAAVRAGGAGGARPVRGPASTTSARPASSSPRRTRVAANSAQTAPTRAMTRTHAPLGEPGDGLQRAGLAEQGGQPGVGADALRNVTRSAGFG